MVEIGELKWFWRLSLAYRMGAATVDETTQARMRVATKLRCMMDLGLKMNVDFNGLFICY